MKMHLNLFFFAAVFSASVACADTTLVYELVNAQGETIEHTYTIRGRYMRVDSNAESQPYSLILDAGYMIMHVVDGNKAVFSTFGASPFHQGKQVRKEPKDAASMKTVVKNATAVSSLRPTGSKDTVAGMRCRIVNEIVNDKPVAEHCMADTVALGMTPRELITMARLIEFSKDRTDPDWIAAQSHEKFISIRSRPPGADASFILKAVSHETASRDSFRVPPEYQKLELDSEAEYAGLITGKK